MDTAAIQHSTRSNERSEDNYPTLNSASNLAEGLANLVGTIEVAKNHPIKISNRASVLGKALGAASTIPAITGIWSTYQAETNNPSSLYEKLNAGTINKITKVATPLIIGGMAGVAVAGTVAAAPVALGLAAGAAVSYGVSKGLDFVEQGYKNLWSSWF